MVRFRDGAVEAEYQADKRNRLATADSELPAIDWAQDRTANATLDVCTRFASAPSMQCGAPSSSPSCGPMTCGGAPCGQGWLHWGAAASHHPTCLPPAPRAAKSPPARRCPACRFLGQSPLGLLKATVWLAAVGMKPVYVYLIVGKEFYLQYR